MPPIQLPEGLPGILGPMAYRPETQEPLNELAEILLRGPSTLTRRERELIATYLSSQNDCFFCQTIHGAVAAHHLDGNEQLVLEVKESAEQAAFRPSSRPCSRLRAKCSAAATACNGKMWSKPAGKGRLIRKFTTPS